MNAQVHSVGEVDEFDLIAQITRNVQLSPAISIGPGDDAAGYLINGSALTSTDLLVEGVHFRRDWCSGEDVGRKAVAVNVADLEAMGASPVAMVVGLAMPADLELTWLREFNTGLLDEAGLAGISLVGGDLTRAPQIVVSVTVTGQSDAVAPVLRSGARPGEVIAVRGQLGWSAAGLATLARGFRSPRAAVEAYRHPKVPYGAGRQAALAGATAMLDVSDGLLSDLSHLAHDSGVCMAVDSARLTVDEPVATVAAALNKDPLEFILAGGEDHALAATFPVGSVPEDWDVIGVVQARDDHGDDYILVDGSPWQGSTGWRHFGK